MHSFWKKVKDSIDEFDFDEALEVLQ